MKEKSENRRAMPKFFLTMLASLLVGGLVGFVVGFSRVFGLDAAGFTQWLDGVLRAATPWGIPVTTVPVMGGAFLLYRSAKRKLSAWDGGDEDENSESIEILLSWVLLLSATQLLINLFFMTAIAVYGMEEGTLAMVGVFIASCAMVVFAQQKAVDMERRMNPEKRGSVYDTQFQKKWMDSCDESERQQIGQACYRAYMVTNRVCMGLWLALTILGMVLDFSLLPVFVLLLVWGVMQAAYTLECIRLSKQSG